MTESALTVAYCGPIAPRGEPARGGYEAANRRLIDDLARAGITVVENPYPSQRGSRLAKLLGYGVGFAKLAVRTLLLAGRWNVFHITPLRDQFAWPEALLCRLAGLRGAKIVVDLRAGTLADSLASPRRYRRAALVDMLRRADGICVEGLEYLQLVAPFAQNPFYLPNYVDAARIGFVRAAPDAAPRLVFLGRIVPEKGIEVALDCVRMLRRRGIDPALSVIGQGEDAYMAELKAGAADLPVQWLGAVPHGQVQEKLAGSHFFVFPSTHYGEGHSNALTEAMSQGLVPVVSDNGFNRGVVDLAGVVLKKDATGADYADAIIGILEKGEWASRSTAARERVAEQYSGHKLVPALIDRYRALLP